MGGGLLQLPGGSLRNRVANGWAQIDVQLKQRADLVPNLWRPSRGTAAHESEVFTQVTEARAGAVAAAADPKAGAVERAAAENKLSRALVNLQATAEAYPAAGRRTRTSWICRTS